MKYILTTIDGKKHELSLTEFNQIKGLFLPPPSTSGNAKALLSNPFQIGNRLFVWHHALSYLEVIPDNKKPKKPIPVGGTIKPRPGSYR